MNKHLFDFILYSTLLLCFSSSAKLRTQTTSLDEATAKSLVFKYQPVVYLHKSESYFPSSIESLQVDWSKVKMLTDDTYFEYTYKGPSTFNNSAPIYTSVYEDINTNTARISYVFFFPFNGCGPKAHVKAKMVGLGLDEMVNVCPADVHWGDIEHIEVYVKRSNSNSNYNTISSIKYAYHQWSKTYTSDGSQDGKISDHVKFEDSTHPVVYLAKGSHASYTSPGSQEYYTIFSESKKGFYNTYAKLVDYCAPSSSDAYRWFGNAKLLKLNGDLASGLSKDENSLAKYYYGRIGGQIENEEASDLISVLNKIRKVAKGLSFTSLVKKIDSAKSSLNNYFQSTGITGLASPKRTWW